MHVFVDTNVLLRSVQKRHPACRIARQSLLTLLRDEHSLYLTPQNVAEFWNVCTRPVDANGLGLSIAGAERYADQLERFFTILPDSIEAFRSWRKLVFEHAVVGAKVHDTRLVAIMLTFGISRILTFNGPDFKRFSGIEVIHPESLAQ